MNAAVSHVPQDRVRALVTPEGVDLQLKLAEMSERVTAFFIDLFIIGAALTVATLVALLIAFAAGRRSFDLMAIIWLLGSFFLRNFYFMAFELTPRGATPGKRALGLRVAARNGGALGFDAIFARNAMRELEWFLPLSFVSAYGREAGGWAVLAGLVWCGVFALFPLFNRDRLRVGDLVAGTWVIRAPKRALESDLASANKSGEFLFSRAEIDVYGVKELSVLEEVLRKQDGPTMAAVAERIRKKLGREKTTGESDRAFLDAYYVALRGRLEGRLLFGQKKRDKFDKG